MTPVRASRYSHVVGAADRYLMRRVIFPLGAVTIVVGLVVSMWQLARVSHLVLVSWQDAGLLGAIIADLFPTFAAMALGTSGLFGCAVAYDRLAEDGELTAMAASAVGPWRVFRPAMIGGLLMAAGVAAAGIWGEPWGGTRYARDVALLATRSFSRTLKPGSFKGVGNLANVYVGSATVGEDGEDRWEDVVVGRDLPGGPMVMTTRWARVRAAGPGLLGLQTGPGEALIPGDRDDVVHRVTFEEASLNVDVASWVSQETMTLYPFQLLPLPELWARATAADAPREGEGPKLRFHLWQKLCIPLGMLLLCMVGAILGGQRAATARGRGYLLAAVVIAAYFGLLGFGRNLVIQGAVPAPVGANVANAAGMILLVYLWRTRATRWG